MREEILQSYACGENDEIGGFPVTKKKSDNNMESFAKAAEKVQPRKTTVVAEARKARPEPALLSFHDPDDEHIIDDSDADIVEASTGYEDTEVTWLKHGLNVKTKDMASFDMKRRSI